MTMTEVAKPSYAFPATHRLRRQRDFDAVYQAGVAKTVGPLRVFGRPNDLGHCRLGLNVSARVGKAVVRNRIKRLLRESFRLLQHDLPRSYDYIVIVRPHETAGLEDYKRMLMDAAVRLEREWKRRQETGDVGQPIPLSPDS